MLEHLIASRRVPGIDGNVTRLVLIGSAVWTMVVWGSRVRIIENGTTWMWARIFISLTLGVVLLGLAWRHGRGGLRTRVGLMVVYGTWMVIAWVPSLISVLGSQESVGFKSVHTALAVVSLLSGALVASVARQVAFYPPTATSTHTAANSAAR